MFIKKVFVTLIILISLFSCVSSTASKEDRVKLDFSWPENGCIYEGTLIVYVDGNPQEPVPFNTYLWKSDEEGYYKSSWGPYYDTWYIEITIDDYSITAKETDWYTGGKYLIFQETVSVNEVSTANGITTEIKSVTVHKNYISWDGETRVALVQKSIVIDGSEGTFEQPEKGTYTLTYMTSEGVEKTEVYSPNGDIISIQTVTNKINEYSGE